MPLLPGKKNIGANISELHAGKTFAKTKAKFGKKTADKQAVAIAMKTARQSRKPNPAHDATSADWYWGK
jgi:hypothetical protein